MRKLVCALVAMIMICVFGTAYGVQVTITSPNKKVETPDYRDSNWGMNWEEVKAAEGDVVWEAGELYASANGYHTTVGGLDCFALFTFDNGGNLWSGTLNFDGIYTNNFFYINDFETLSEALTKKYGKPTQKNEVWTNDYYKNSKADWGTAVALGYLYLMYEWETQNTSITLILGSQSYNIMLGIVYNDRGNIQETDMSGL